MLEIKQLFSAENLKYRAIIKNIKNTPKSYIYNEYPYPIIFFNYILEKIILLYFHSNCAKKCT